jgi:putative Mg2+ transporter-C (MgtC) family protein
MARPMQSGAQPPGGGDGQEVMDMITIGEMVTRIAVGAVLGGIIGYERDRHQRPAGLRTHLLVAMASATFMVASSHFVYFQHYQKGDLVEVDASRIAASVVSGIGFLAGGAILRTGATIQGLTTAAGLWLVTAIGLCAGAGMYMVSAVVTMMGAASLTVLRRLEDKDDTLLRRKVQVVLDADGVLGSLMASLVAAGVTVQELEYDRRLDEKRRLSVTLDSRIPLRLGIEGLVTTIERSPGVRRVHVEAP